MSFKIIGSSQIFLICKNVLRYWSELKLFLLLSYLKTFCPPITKLLTVVISTSQAVGLVEFAHSSPGSLLVL